jgi:hypothetical protein
MGELDAELGVAVTAAVGDDARQRGFAVIGIEAEAAVADAAAAVASATTRAAPELANVPR